MPFPTANASVTSCLPWPGSPEHRCSRTNAPRPGRHCLLPPQPPGKSENRASPGTARPRGSDLPVPARQPRPEHQAPSCSPRESRAARGARSAAPLRPAAGTPGPPPRRGGSMRLRSPRYLATLLVAHFSPANFSPPSRAVRVGSKASKPKHVTPPAQGCSEGKGS